MEKRLVSFNNKWKDYYASEKEILLKALRGQKISNIEHIGATSVVLCATCGTIDILLSIPTFVDFVTIKNQLTRKGYSLVADKSDYMKVLFFIRRDENQNIVATIRLVEHGGETYNRIMAFKYYLKEKSRNVQKYNEFRKALLEKCNSYAEYQEIKGNYIESILHDFCVFK